MCNRTSFLNQECFYLCTFDNLFYYFGHMCQDYSSASFQLSNVEKLRNLSIPKNYMIMNNAIVKQI